MQVLDGRCLQDSVLPSVRDSPQATESLQFLSRVGAPVEVLAQPQVHVFRINDVTIYVYNRGAHI
jgi:hypothetical protein